MKKLVWIGSKSEFVTPGKAYFVFKIERKTYYSSSMRRWLDTVHFVGENDFETSGLSHCFMSVTQYKLIQKKLQFMVPEVKL